MAKKPVTTEISSMNEDQLKDQLLTLKKEQFNFRFQAATGQLEKTHRVEEVRKNIARVLTALKSKTAA